MADTIYVKAKVSVIVDVECSGAWSPDCPMSQVHRQAAEEAINKVMNSKIDGVSVYKHNGVRVLEISAIATKEPK